MTSNMIERRKIQITGHVQGVFFRASAREQADSLGLAGFTRNEPDGSVLIVVEGEPAKLNQFAAWCHEGPPDAEVARVDSTVEQPEGLREFSVRR